MANSEIDVTPGALFFPFDVRPTFHWNAIPHSTLAANLWMEVCGAK